MGLFSELFKVLGSTPNQARTKSKASPNNVFDRDKAQKLKGDIVIPDDVDEIKSWSFEKNEAITSVTVPGTVKRIGEMAFARCKNLRSVTLHEGIEEIGYDAFMGCEQLSSVTYPDSVKHPHGRSFYHTALKEPVLSASGTVLVFCPASVSDTEWTVPSTVKVIGDGAFFDSANLEILHLPDGLEIIEDKAFWKSAIREITIPYSVRKIGRNAFYECKQLKTVTILNPHTSLAVNAFGGCYQIERIKYSGLHGTDQLFHLKGLPFLEMNTKSSANLHHGTDPEFKRLTVRCATGDGSAMIALADYFEKLSKRKTASSFYLRASNYWRYRAYLSGNEAAIKWFTRFFAKNPDKQLEAILYEYPLFGFFKGEISGKMLNDLGFDFFRSELAYSFEACADKEIVTVSTYAGYDSPDDDGFGMEEYDNYWFLDENMQEIPGIKMVNASSNEIRYGHQYKDERDKAIHAIKQRKLQTK